MLRFQNVLMVYPEWHPEVMCQIADLLRQTDGSLTVVDVLPEIASEMRWLPQGMPLDEFERMLARERQETITAHLPDVLIGRTDKFQVKLLRGKAAMAVIQEAIRSRYDLVIKVATGESGLPGRLFGTMATKLMRKCPTPVWLIKPSVRLLPTRVLAAIDPMRESETDRELNSRIADLAASIAAISGGSWEALHCWGVPGESLLSHGRTRMAPEDLARLVEMTETMHRTRMDALMQAVSPGHQPSAAHMVKGEPGKVIPDFVRSRQFDMVVMGTVTQPGVAGWLSGSTAETVLREADCSLMTVKPLGFVSPVTIDKLPKPEAGNNDRNAR